MSRADLRTRLAPWTETGIALAAAGLGVWLFSLGGWFFWPLGALIAVTCGFWALDAWRRMRFRTNISAPGLVEVDEGAVRYLSPDGLYGGEVALRDLSELRILRVSGQRHWRLKSVDGQALLVPVDAAGSDHLASAFASLPGADMGRISAALLLTAPDVQTVWTKAPRLP